MKFLFILFYFSFITLNVKAEEISPSHQTYWPQTFWHTLMTQWSLKKETYDKAYQHSIKALEKDPLVPELQINLGNTLEGLGSLTKAREAYRTAEKLSQESSMQFESRFNQAQVLAKEKKIDEALEMYQKALDLDPESKIVKTNIELLLSSSKSQGKGDSKENDENKEEGEKQENQDGKGSDQKKNEKFSENPKNDKEQKSKQPKSMSQGDVKKILEEIKQQEQRIRGDFYKQEGKQNKTKSEDSKKGKDW